MNYLKIKNWDRWQSYRNDRGQPPWIKVHRCVLRNPEWVSLSDAEKGQLLSMWLLAADRDGEIPDSEELVKKLCFLTNKPDFNKFKELSFLETDSCQCDANMTPICRQDDCPDKNRIEEIREEQNSVKKSEDDDFDIFWKNYPKKVGKAQAKKAWLKLKKSKKLPEIDVLLQAISKQKTSQLWIKDNGQYIPHPSTWLNGERWNDEPFYESNIKQIEVINRDPGVRYVD